LKPFSAAFQATRQLSLAIQSMFCQTRLVLLVGLALLPAYEAEIDFVAAGAAIQSTTPRAFVDRKPNTRPNQEIQAFNAEELASFVRSRSKKLDGSRHANLMNELRSSVVRIQKIETVVNWFEPYGDTKKSSSVGTGFAAKLIDEENGEQEIPPNTEEDPIFITNAHVARNAESLRLQLSAIGQRSFEAHVPVIYDVHDLAIVKLNEPKEFMQYLNASNVKLRVLRVRKHEVSLGLSAIAIGFPLASKTLKLSMGVIAGTESFEGHTVLQCTAPISPGNSGGPLLQVGDEEAVGDAVDVVGVNFAAIPDHAAENVNYVVPALHVRQIIRRFWDGEKKRQQAQAKEDPQKKALRANLRGENGPQAQQEVYKKLMMQSGGDPNVLREIVGGGGQKENHVSLRLAPLEIKAVPADDATYAFGKCQEGVFITTIEEKSALAAANPPVQAMSFITEVNGVTLDNFGAGRVEKEYLKDPLPFTSMLQMQERVEGSNTIKVCRNGKLTEHTLSMDWQDRFETGVREVREPFYEQQAFDYEVFAEVTIMQMSINHIAMLMGRIPSYDRWLTPEGIREPKLLVTKVQPGGYGASVLSRGMVLSTVNGEKVNTLEDYRRVFEKPNSSVWSLETERGVVYRVDFTEAMHNQLQRVQDGEKFLMTPSVTSWCQKMMAAEQAKHPEGQVQMILGGGQEDNQSKGKNDGTGSLIELKQVQAQHVTQAQSSSRLRVASIHQGSHTARTKKWQSLTLTALAAAVVEESSFLRQAHLGTALAWRRSQEWQPDLPHQAAIPERSPWPWRPQNRGAVARQSGVRLLASEAMSGTSPIGLEGTNSALLDDVRMQLRSEAFI